MLSFPFRMVPAGTNFDFVGKRSICAIFSAFIVVGSLVLALTYGLNFGIDFKGGTLIEVRTEEPADISGMRAQLSTLGLGDFSLQEFGNPTDVLIRVESQSDGSESQQVVVDLIRDALGSGVEYRRTEFVGPTVGDELREAGLISVLLALGAIMIYIWFRFEWQFSVGAIIALAHDVITTVGVFAILQMEFNLATVAAILTIAGYSINDTVVVFDRVRENLRRYKSLTVAELLNRSINETLSRTAMTSVTTLLALLALYVFGGEVIRGFSFALIWGVVIGTYSSIFIAVPTLLWIGLRTRQPGDGSDSEDTPQEAIEN